MRALLIITIFTQILMGCSSTPTEQDKRYLAVQQVNQGRMHLKKNNFSQAETSFVKAIKLDPDNSEIYGLAGQAAKKSGHYNEAITFYKKSAELNPTDYRPYGNMGWIYKKLESYDKALAAFNKVLDINPKEIRALDDIADIYFKQKDYDNCQLYIDKYEATLSELDNSLFSNKSKIRIELSRNNHATYKSAMLNQKI